MAWYVAESWVAYNFFGEYLGWGEGWKKGKMPGNRKKKMSPKKQKKREGENPAVSLINQNPHFAFCACANVEGWIYETEGRKRLCGKFKLFTTFTTLQF